MYVCANAQLPSANMNKMAEDSKLNQSVRAHRNVHACGKLHRMVTRHTHAHRNAQGNARTQCMLVPYILFKDTPACALVLTRLQMFPMSCVFPLCSLCCWLLAYSWPDFGSYFCLDACSWLHLFLTSALLMIRYLTACLLMTLANPVTKLLTLILASPHLSVWLAVCFCSFAPRWGFPLQVCWELWPVTCPEPAGQVQCFFNLDYWARLLFLTWWFSCFQLFNL